MLLARYLQGVIYGAALLCGFCGSAQPVIKVSAGHNHSIILKGDGSLWGMGQNGNGHLGDGTVSNNTSYLVYPERILSSNVTTVAAGTFHSLFLKRDGSFWVMGENAVWQLGDGTYNTAYIPERIVDSNVTAIAAGSTFSVFLKRDGSLWTMGDNHFGQLGDGSLNYVGTNQPDQIVTSNVTTIATGDYHTLFLKRDGSLWGMGNNFSGQLGDGTTSQANSPEQIVSSNVLAIAAGSEHSLFIKNDGSLWGMGDNSSGQLGGGSLYRTNRPMQIVLNDVAAIAARAACSFFLKRDGGLWAMGYNQFGQLGNGVTNSVSVPQRIVPNGVTSVASGALHTLFCRSDGSLWATGWNRYGQLGDGTTNDVYLPKQIVAGPSGYNHISVQLLTGGDVRLSSVGLPDTNYVLDRSYNLMPADWIPQQTNPAAADGTIVFTNTPNRLTNSFWRVHATY